MSVSVRARGGRPVVDEGLFTKRAGPVTVHAGRRQVWIKGAVGRGIGQLWLDSVLSTLLRQPFLDPMYRCFVPEGFPYVPWCAGSCSDSFRRTDVS